MEKITKGAVKNGEKERQGPETRVFLGGICCYCSFWDWVLMGVDLELV